VGPEGSVSKFITDNKLGFVLNENNINETALHLIENITAKKIPDTSFDLSEYTFEYQTKLLINHLNNYYATKVRLKLLKAKGKKTVNGIS
jgi:hypothetical protein